MEKVPFIIWNENFSVGIKQMDDQHQFLISIINDLFYASRNNQADHEIHKVIEQMIKYTRIHFTSEEALLKKYQYPGFDAQRTAHQLFNKQVLDFQTRVLLKQMTVDIEVLTFLKEWWTKHILGHDLLYTDYFKQKGMFNQLNK